MSSGSLSLYPDRPGANFQKTELMAKGDGQMRKPMDNIVVFIFVIVLSGLLITSRPGLCYAQEKPVLRTDIK